jgi:hypothetical protein
LFWSRLVFSVEIDACSPMAIWPLSVVNRQENPVRPERHFQSSRPVRAAVGLRPECEVATDVQGSGAGANVVLC